MSFSPRTHLTDAWPDTDLAYMSRATRVRQLQVWVREVATWLRAAGAPWDDVRQALEGAVPWIESEIHRERHEEHERRREEYQRRRKDAPARRERARQEAERE